MVTARPFEPVDFNRSVLLISARSPFARRVRLAFREKGISYEERVLDVLHPTEELIRENPLARVPTLLLASGQTLMDSNLILQLFYESVESPLMPRDGEARVECLRWMALAAGACEKLVEHYLERLRPEASRDPETLQEITGILDRVMGRVEKEIGRRDTILHSGLSQADLDLGTLLAYYGIRYTEDWHSRYPNAAFYFKKLDQRPTFQATRPPKA